MVAWSGRMSMRAAMDLAGSGDGTVLEEFAYLAEEHDGDRFGVLAKTECADCGDGHEEVFVEDFSVGDVAGGTEEDVKADDEVRDEGEEKEEAAGFGGKEEEEKESEVMMICQRVRFCFFVRERGMVAPGSSEYDAVGLDLFADFFCGQDDLIDAGFVCFDDEFLDHEAEGCVSDAVNISDARLHEGGTVSAFEVFESEDFFHGWI